MCICFYMCSSLHVFVLYLKLLAALWNRIFQLWRDLEVALSLCMILWTLSITDFENFFHLCAEILHVTLFWIFFLDIKFVFVLIVLTIVWFTHMIRYLKLSMDFEFILLHIWMAFSDVLDLAEAAFCQKITKYNSQM